MSLYGGGIYEIETTDPDILSNIVTIFDGALHAKILMKEAHKVRLSYITPEGGLGFFAFLKDKAPDDIQRFNINKLSSFAKSRTGDITSFLNKSIYT